MHLTEIIKGEYGKVSKIREELSELDDAIAQNSRILAIIELSDLYGALEGVIEGMGMTMEDLKTFSDIVKKDKQNGS